MNTFLTFIYATFGNLYLLFIIECFAILCKSYLLFKVITYMTRERFQKMALFLLLTLIGTMADDISWLTKITQILFLPALSYTFITFIIRIAWIFVPITWQSLSLFLETLAEPHKKISLHHRLFLPMTIGIISSYIFFMFTNFNVSSAHAKTPLEYAIMLYSLPFCICVLLLSVMLTIYKIKTQTIPRIVKKQINTIIKLVITPLFLTEIYHLAYPSGFIPKNITASYSIITFITIGMTWAIYFCARKITNIRFMNIYNHVHEVQKLSLVENFKEILDQLSNVESKQELINLTKTFFKQAFKIPMGRTDVYLRSENEITHTKKITPSYIEQFMKQEDNTCFIDNIYKKRILIYDELEFSQYYHHEKTSEILLNFMKKINADLFVPIFDHHTIIGYIYVERDARINELYSDLERDEIVVFASFAANIINLLQNNKIEAIISQHKQIKEELFQKHQEINQYKESLKLFLEESSQKEIGIIFYKNRKFIFGNQQAKELVMINPSLHEGHPLAQALKKLVKNVTLYQTSQEGFSVNDKGRKLKLSAIPNLDAHNIIITVHYPDISDTIKKQKNNLKNPSEWDYLLYLETTKAGTLINTVFPGEGETFLNLKIKLLKSALSKRTLLLKGPDDDLKPTAELLHHISMREHLHILKLEHQETNLLIKLFGINHLFGTHIETPLLEKLNGNGTIFIQNIHLMNQESQQSLSHYLKYGYYKPYKGNNEIKSDVRIICSTHHNLSQLVEENKFCRSLYEQLKETSLELPSLLQINENELSELADAITTQSIKNKSVKKLLSLTPHEKNKLIMKKTVSLKKFKEHVAQILYQKSKNHNVEESFAPARNLVDPELIKAAELGKHALRDPKTMGTLWKKFKNQNKIATFLGVNRSSVNRRCNEYKLH
jgi:DNA-binding NtrC family response regulator